MPSRAEVLEYIKRADGAAARRDIARAFGVKGEARTELRMMLKQMEAEGILERPTRSRFAAADMLPPVAPIDVMSVDDDGDLICMPANWRGDGPAPMIRVLARKAARTKPVPGVGDRLLARLKQAGEDGYEAEIIKAIGKSAHRFLAVFRAHRDGSGEAEPVEKRARNNFQIDRQDANGAREGDLVWVETKNARGYGPRKGRIRSIEGHIDRPNAFSLIALANHGIKTDFSEAVMKEALHAKLPTSRGREDLRALPLITIDPADAKDHDDAVFAAPDDDPDNDGGYRIMVAIADVAYFVQPGSELDREALARGNSTYLPDRVAPMLPERLSNDLCSLREGEDRPCLAVEMTITADGVKTGHRFLRGIMRSAARLSYEDAQEIINQGDKNDDAGETALVPETVLHLHAAFRARLNERAKRAPLDLDLPEKRIVLNDQGKVKKIVKRDRFDAHRLVEEFMILANVAAAETLEQARHELVYRVHDQPDPEKLDGVRDYLESLDYRLIKGGSVRPAHFNQLLKLAEERDEKEMVSDVVLRSQRQAVYTTDNLGHFGLNLARYAHFTSPIRRYADLIVHRALIHAGKLGPGGSVDKSGDLEKIAGDISDTERRSMAAEREATDRYLAAYLSDRVGAEFDGRIRGVTRFGLFVMLDETGADGFVPIRTLGFERFRFEADLHSLIGETTGGVYRLGQDVTVRLEEATPLTGGLRFEMLTDPIGVKSTRKTSRKKTTRKKAKPTKTKSGKSGARGKASPKSGKAAKRKKSAKKPKRSGR